MKWLSPFIHTTRKKVGRCLWPCIPYLLVAVIFVIPWCVGAYFLPSKEAVGREYTEAEDFLAYDHLRQGYRHASDGLIKEARSEFSAALAADSERLRAEAAALLSESHSRQKELGVWGAPLVSTSAGARALQPVVAVILLLLLLRLAYVWLPPREGTQIEDFAVYGTQDDSAGKAFQSALLHFLNDIKRGHGSEFARRFLQAPPPEQSEDARIKTDDPFETALKQAGEKEARAAMQSTLVLVLQWLGTSGRRPAITIRGSVQLLPTGAKVVAELKDYRPGSSGAALCASTEEFETLRDRAIVAARLLGHVPAQGHRLPLTEGVERREVGSQLNMLALILACKVRFRESKLSISNFRPASWQTVCLFTAASSPIH